MTTEPTTTGDRAPRDRQAATQLLGLLGLAQKAGQLAVGATAVANLIRRGRRPLVVVARDAGAAQRRRYLAWRPVHGFVAELVTRSDLATALGRRDLAVVAVGEAGFVAGIDRLGATAAPGALTAAGESPRPARDTARSDADRRNR